MSSLSTTLLGSPMDVDVNAGALASPMDMDLYHYSTDISTSSDTDDSGSDAESPREDSHDDSDACPLEKIFRDSQSCDIADARTRINFQMSYPW